ncbi:thiamine pyrophosphate-dependent dehydrogenase E1 component subunit alpha [Candidatus Protofrankia californiensis]|uniref:thiamine pyrophosphate-dependent dehydrogenase E1 component subunit alpha n=1 Tax=Candidatus Protofrankia californiensis TaxID=1839754 RepID=UPI0019D1E656|nr:thiamine pyrophosphate-dependent dehydrogenase E1 component subunit alpha [Candidatus Protofrankia californiensis]
MTTGSTIAAVLTDEKLVEMQRRMLRIRLFDSRAVELQSAALLPGPIHTSIGHEAAIVGACMALRNDDYMTGYHRSHGHPIGKGSRLAPLMAELLGRSDGICRGKGGSLHLADFSVGSLGESGIVGAGLPIAVGAGLSARMLGTDRVSLGFFGDGAANTGPFHEAMNLASIWQTPTIFFCENNGYAVSFSIKEAMKVEHVVDRAAGYSIPGVRVDGQDVLAVHAAVTEAVARARTGGGPTLVEAATYRFREHAEMLPTAPYRAADEVERWKARDPIALFRQVLIRRGVATEEELRYLEDEVTTEVNEAVQFAKDSPQPEPDAAFEDLFVNPIVVRGAN